MFMGNIILQSLRYLNKVISGKNNINSCHSVFSITSHGVLPGQKTNCYWQIIARLDDVMTINHVYDAASSWQYKLHIVCRSVSKLMISRNLQRFEQEDTDCHKSATHHTSPSLITLFSLTSNHLVYLSIEGF